MYELKTVRVYKMFSSYIVSELFHVGIGETTTKETKEFYTFYYTDLMQNKKIKSETMCSCTLDTRETILYSEKVLIGYGFVDN